MKEYRVIEGGSNLEDSINDAARHGFRAVLMAATAEGLITVPMEREVSEPGSRA